VVSGAWREATRVVAWRRRPSHSPGQTSASSHSGRASGSSLHARPACSLRMALARILPSTRERGPPCRAPSHEPHRIERPRQSRVHDDNGCPHQAIAIGAHAPPPAPWGRAHPVSRAPRAQIDRYRPCRRMHIRVRGRHQWTSPLTRRHLAWQVARKAVGTVRVRWPLIVLVARRRRSASATSQRWKGRSSPPAPSLGQSASR